MASDYKLIRADNEKRYGTDIGRIGPMLLADRYDDRTHFIFELLQNAEDALSRRVGWHGSRAVTFHLAGRALRVSHYGEPFDERDVWSICSIAESTKDLTAIGRHGIGFKSVYAFADRPEVHSGAEDFAIENYVWPTAAPPIERADDETFILLPLEAQHDTDLQEITRGLQRLGPRMLLFLRQIEEIAWHVEQGPSGLYLRSKPEAMGDNVRRITVIGQEEGKPDIEETWLLFSREAKTEEGAVAGHVEISFSIGQEKETNGWSIEPISDSPLVVFFPTVLQTNLGFLVQGPYRTTPSRDNVPRNEPWNQHLVSETTELLVEALRWLRDQGMLGTAVLGCLPLDRAHFGDTNMFAPLFEATRQALLSEPLLPRSDGGHVAASNARLARTQDLRDLLGPSQLGELLGLDGEIAWLSADITLNRTPELRKYLLDELEIDEITPEGIVPKLGKEFLEAQSDEWILRLYEFLSGQPTLLRLGRLSDIPLVRLDDGTHVGPQADGQPQAFLPGAVESGFPTVRRAVCGTVEARRYLESLGLTEPDAVDDVVRNLLPKYRADEIDVGDVEYKTDIHRILTAFGTDSKGQREKLLAALRETAFVMAVDKGDESKWVSRPGEVYLATDRLKALFAGVADVLLVDDAYSCLRGENVRELLEACGATRTLRPIMVNPAFTWEQRCEMRIAAGCESMSSEEPIKDHSLHGLEGLLKLLSELNEEERSARAVLLWEALGDLEDRRGAGIFSGSYRWFYVSQRSTTFDEAFLRQLNDTAWVPGANEQLVRPELILFDTLGWESDPFLLSKIRFKPPIIETLAKEAGIELGVLDLLKQLGVTSEAELRSKLGIVEPEPDDPEPLPGSVDIAPDPMPPVPGPSGPEPTGAGNGNSKHVGSSTGASSGRGNAPQGSAGGGKTGSRSGPGNGKRRPGSVGGRPFISYVGAHPDDDESDPDGLDQTYRMALEEKAIDLILTNEMRLQRTPAGNPGFDLFEANSDGNTVRRVEVKAMTGGLHDRPVGLSRTQFECAREHGEAYWLYVVEHAGTDDACIVRIQDPAGKARTFTFDHGWLAVAGEETEKDDSED
ncbi:MAG: DUF3883 domain-containing protein [Proteobacteria bacterium]|nr:DUF3883 domain-containing protein [Pseudomonadota bacterium]